MNRDRTLSLASAVCILLGISVAFAGCMLSVPAHAQYGYQCPPAYYFYPGYGCVVPGYFYGPPYYAYPDFGFDFFYGGGWGRRWGRNYGPGGGFSRGGGGGAARGGGGHGGGHGGR